MNEEKRALKKFYEEVGERYPEEEEVYHTLRGILRKEFILAHLQKFRGSLLDVGCNRGMYLNAYEGGERFGVDLSLNVLRKAHNRSRLHLAVADAERLQCFKSASFDHVLCSEVLEHCLHPQAIFAGIAHVLKPGGVALLTTPNYTRRRPKWIALGPLTRYDIDCECDDGYFHTAYRPEELRRMAREADLRVLKVGTLEKEVKYAAKIPVVFLLLGRLLNRLLRSERLDRLNEALFNQLTILIYRICHATGLEKLLLRMIPEGVRSYVIMQRKGDES